MDCDNLDRLGIAYWQLDRTKSLLRIALAARQAVLLHADSAVPVAAISWRTPARPVD